MTPLHQAVLENQLEAVKVLVHKGADLGLRGFRDALKGTPLEFAEHEKHKHIIKYLQKVRIILCVNQHLSYLWQKTRDTKTNSLQRMICAPNIRELTQSILQ